MRVFVAFLILANLLTACSSEEQERTPLASVDDKKLYPEDLEEQIPPGIDPADSASMAAEIIEKWTREQALLVQAESYLKNERSEIDAEMEKIRVNMMVQRYLEKRVAEILDTNVSAEEIRAYYENNPFEFEIDEYLVRAILIQLPKDAAIANELWGLYRKSDSVALERMRELTIDRARYKHLDLDAWLRFNEVQGVLPPNAVEYPDYFVKQRSKRRFEDDEFYYFVNIVDYRTGTSPLEFEQENIRSRILQQRMSELRVEVKEQAIKDVYEKGLVKSYE